MKKHLKAILTAVLAFTLCAAMAGCGATENEESKQTSAKTSESTSSTADEVSTEPSSETEAEETVDTENKRTPSGAKVSNDIPLSIVKFGDYNGNELFSIDIADCTVAELVEVSDEKTEGLRTIEVTNEGAVEKNEPNFKFLLQAFRWAMVDFSIEATIGGEVVDWNEVGYATDNYADMKISALAIYRSQYNDNEIAFCDGAIVYGTSRSDVEALLGEGKEFSYYNGARTMYVYENDTATFGVDYGKKDSVERIYLFVNN